MRYSPGSRPTSDRHDNIPAPKGNRAVGRHHRGGSAVALPWARLARNVEAGEDIRWISEQQARELDIPDYDFYLIDDERVAIMRFDRDKVLTGLELVDDLDTVARHRAYRDAVWTLAIRHDDYLARAERGT